PRVERTSDVLSGAPHSFHRTRGWSDRRKKYRNAGAASQVAFHLDRPARFTDDALYRRQTQSCALSQLLGGEERLEQPRPRLPIHPAAVVSHHQRDGASPALALGFTGKATRGCFRKFRRPRAQRNRSTLRQGIAGVQHQVQQDLPQLCRIGQHQPGAGVERRVEQWVEQYDQLNRFADQPPQKIFRGSDNFVDLDRARLRHLLARDRQQFPRQRRALLARHADFFHVLAQPARFHSVTPQGRVSRSTVLQSNVLQSNVLQSAALQSRDQQVAVQQDAGQQVIEVVRDSSRQPPDRFHLLGLTETFFQPFALGRVRQHRDQKVAAGVAPKRHRQMSPEFG